MSQILIAPYSLLTETVRRHRPSHVLTLMVEPHVETPESIARDRHLRLCVHDIAEAVEGSVAPDESHIANLLGFARSWDRIGALSRALLGRHQPLHCGGLYPVVRSARTRTRRQNRQGPAPTRASCATEPVMIRHADPSWIERDA
jgi:hypothetical protein